MYVPCCIICGSTKVDLTAACLFTGKTRCDKGECYVRAREFDQKKTEIMREYAIEKERLLRPLSEKLDSDLFLLDREYLKGEEI